MKHQSYAEAEHSSLSKLFLENPTAFYAVKKKLTDNIINKSTNPKKMRELQDSMADLFKTDEELELERSLKQLKKKFKGG